MTSRGALLGSWKPRAQFAPDRFLLTKPNTSCTIDVPASLRSDGVRDNPGMPFGIIPDLASDFAGIPNQASPAPVPTCLFDGTAVESFQSSAGERTYLCLLRGCSLTRQI